MKLAKTRTGEKPVSAQLNSTQLVLRESVVFSLFAETHNLLLICLLGSVSMDACGEILFVEPLSACERMSVCLLIASVPLLVLMLVLVSV